MQNINEEFLGEGMCDIQNATSATLFNQKITSMKYAKFSKA
jgi:hypothetical protein